MAGDVSGTDGADLHVPGCPNHLRLILRLERPHICERSRSGRGAVSVFGSPLRDFARLNHGVGDMCNEFLAADRMTEWGRRVIAADDVDHWRSWIAQPTMHQ